MHAARNKALRCSLLMHACLPAIPQVAVNRQLMAKKEETEWQLMAALAKVRPGERRCYLLRLCLYCLVQLLTARFQR